MRHVCVVRKKVVAVYVRCRRRILGKTATTILLYVQRKGGSRYYCKTTADRGLRSRWIVSHYDA